MVLQCFPLRRCFAANEQFVMIQDFFLRELIILRRGRKTASSNFPSRQTTRESSEKKKKLAKINQFSFSELDVSWKCRKHNITSSHWQTALSKSYHPHPVIIRRIDQVMRFCRHEIVVHRCDPLGDLLGLEHAVSVLVVGLLQLLDLLLQLGSDLGVLQLLRMVPHLWRSKNRKGEFFWGRKRTPTIWRGGRRRELTALLQF